MDNAATSPGPSAGQPTKLFLGGLSYDTTDDSLKEYFESYGEVESAVVMRDPSTMRSRGFGFVTFCEMDAANEVVAHTHHTIDGRKVEAKFAVPRTASSSPTSPGPGSPRNSSKKPHPTLNTSLINASASSAASLPRSPFSAPYSAAVTGSLQSPKSVAGSMADSVASAEETDELQDLPNLGNDKSDFRKNSISSSSSSSNSEDPKRKQQIRKSKKKGGRRDEQNASNDGDGGSIISNKIFVGGLLYATGHDSLRKFFEAFGEVESAEVIYNRDTKKSRGFGFVIFKSHDAVNRVLNEQEENGMHIVDGKQVEVKPCVARQDTGKEKNKGATGAASKHGTNAPFPHPHPPQHQHQQLQRQQHRGQSLPQRRSARDEEEQKESSSGEKRVGNPWNRIPTQIRSSSSLPTSPANAHLTSSQEHFNMAQTHTVHSQLQRTGDMMEPLSRQQQEQMQHIMRHQRAAAAQMAAHVHQQQRQQYQPPPLRHSVSMDYYPQSRTKSTEAGAMPVNAVYGSGTSLRSERTESFVSSPASFVDRNLPQSPRSTQGQQPGSPYMGAFLSNTFEHPPHTRRSFSLGGFGGSFFDQERCEDDGFESSLPRIGVDKLDLEPRQRSSSPGSLTTDSSAIWGTSSSIQSPRRHGSLVSTSNQQTRSQLNGLGRSYSMDSSHFRGGLFSSRSQPQHHRMSPTVHEHDPFSSDGVDAFSDLNLGDDVQQVQSPLQSPLHGAISSDEYIMKGHHSLPNTPMMQQQYQQLQYSTSYHTTADVYGQVQDPAHH